MSFTVTATEAGSTAVGIAVVVKVLTSQSGSQPGTVTGQTSTSNSMSITPANTGSWVYGSLLGLAGTYTPLSGTTVVQDGAGGGLEYISLRSTSTTTALTPVTLGATSAHNAISMALAEIVASGTLAEDASSPAGTGHVTAATATTAAFSPPAGSLLVLMVQSNGGAGTTTMGISDTSGLSLTWVEQEKQNGAGNGYAGVWTALVPGAAAEAFTGTARVAATMAGAASMTGAFAGALRMLGRFSAPPPPSATPWQFNVAATYGAKGDGQIVSDGSMSSSTLPTHLACTTSTPFKAGDAGKAIIVKGAGPSGVTSLVTTIASFTDSGHVVLTTGASATISGATVMWASDDTAAFQGAVNDAVSYAQAHSQYAEVVIQPSSGLFYGIAGALSHANSGNAQITLPVISATADTLTLVIRGAQDGSAIRHWDQLVPQTGGSCLMSFGAYPDPTTQANDINAHGQSAMIGGPTGTSGYGTNAELFSNMMVIIKGMSLLTTHSANGLGYGAAWLWGVIQANVEDTGYGTAGIFNLPGSGDYNSVSSFANGVSVGLGMPATANQNDQALRNVTCGGGYTYGLLATEHTDMQGCHIFYCWGGLCAVGSWSDGAMVTSLGSVHKIRFTQIGIEGCTHSLMILGAGSSGVGPFIEGSIDSESGLAWTDNNSGTGLAAALGEIHLTGTLGGSLTTTSPTSLTIIDERAPVGPGTAWSLTVGTAFQNPVWRWATVTLYGGTSLTGVSLAGLRGGSSAPSVSSVYSQAAAALPPLPVRVPPGGWLKVSGTGSPTAPTATVVYD